MSNRDIQDLKRRLDRFVNEKKYESALRTAIELGSLYSSSKNYRQAVTIYQDAINYASKCANDTSEKVENEYLAYRSVVEMLFECGTQNEILKALKNFMNHVKNLDVSKKQIALHIASLSYLEHLTQSPNYLEKARKYANLSLELLVEQTSSIDKIVMKVKDDSNERDDSSRRKAGIYQLLTNICEAEGNLNEAETYCNKALEYDKLNIDHELHYILLHTKRKFVNRNDLLDISLKMLKIVGTDYDKKLETYLFIAEDSLIHKNITQAEEYYWKVYNDSKCKVERKENAKQGLIKLFKLEQRLKAIAKLKATSSPDFLKIARIYEKCGDEMSIDGLASELAIEYYMKMVEASKNLPGDPEFGDLELTRAAFISLAETYYDLKAFSHSIDYYNQLYTVELRLGRSQADLADNYLNIALKMIECDEYSFEQRREAFLKVNMPNNDSRYVKYVKSFINFLKSNKHEDGADDLLIELQHTDVIDETSDSEHDVPETTTSNFYDEYDSMSEKEMFKRIQKKWDFRGKIEATKKRLNVKNTVGENDLHEASKRSLEDVKFLIEKCGFVKVINEKDNGGWTPLSEAVSYGQADIVKYLTSKGANVNTASTVELKSGDKICTGSGQTPLMEACTQGNYEIICNLIKAGADATMQNDNGWFAGDYLDEYIKLNANEIDQTVLVQLRQALKWLREKEALLSREKRREKKADLPENLPQKIIPSSKKLLRHKEGLEMFVDVLEHLGRKPYTLNSKEYNFENDAMLDDENFIIPDDEEGDDGNKENKSDMEMDEDDKHFRKNSGFRSTRSNKSRKDEKEYEEVIADSEDEIPKRARANSSFRSSKSDRSRKNEMEVEDVIIDSDDEPSRRKGTSRRCNRSRRDEMEIDEVIVESEDEMPRKKGTKRKATPSLTRRESYVSLESSSSKKSKKSTSTCKSSTKSDIIMDESETVETSNLSPIKRLKLKELHLRFFDDAFAVAKKIRLHPNLSKICLKGSDFEDGIDEVIDSIRSCQKLTELDLSQIEQIESQHVKDILDSCQKLKILDLYGTSILGFELKETYLLEKLIIAKTPFEFTDAFFEQINALHSLSYLDVSHTCISLDQLLSKIMMDRPKLHIEACPVLSHLNTDSLSSRLSNLNMNDKFSIKLSQEAKNEIITQNPISQRFLL